MGLVEKLLCKIFSYRDILTSDKKSLYLRRLFVYGDDGDKNFWEGSKSIKVCIHKLCVSDSDRDPHDHPNWFITLPLWPLWHVYTDEQWGLEKDTNGIPVRRVGPFFQKMFAGIPVLRTLNHIHRVVLNRDKLGREIPAWTFVIMGKGDHRWGFFDQTGKKTYFRDYVRKD